MASTRRFLTGKLSVPECVPTPIPPEGTTDHSVLTNRDLPDQHPIEAITGLVEALDNVGGTSNHADLMNRDLPDQHPIEAITGLLEALDKLKDDIANLDVGNEFVPGMNMFHLYTSIEPVIGKFYAVNKAAFIGPTSVDEGVWGFITMETGNTSKRRLFLVQATVVEGDEEAIPDVEYVQISYVWELTPSDTDSSDFVPGFNMFMSYIGVLPTVDKNLTIPDYAFIGPTSVGKTVYGFLNGENNVKGRLFLCRCVVKETSVSDIDIPQYIVTIKSVKEIPDVGATTPTQTGVPVGTIITSMLYAIPDGYLNCNGEVYNIADYPDLAAAFVTSFGKSNQFGGDGETTFAVPNLSDTFLYGVHFENQQMQHHIGETGGEETHTLTIDEMPGHHHSLMETNESGTMHMHAITTEYVNSTLTAGAIGSAGGNTAHNNLPPYFRIAYYIKY